MTLLAPRKAPALPVPKNFDALDVYQWLLALGCTVQMGGSTADTHTKLVTSWISGVSANGKKFIIELQQEL